MTTESFIDSYGYAAILIGTFLEGETILVVGTIRNIRRHRLIFGIRYTSFDLYGGTGSFLRVHYNRKVYYGEDTKVVVQGRFNKSRGLIEASDVKPE